MLRRRFGKTGIALPVLSCGGMRYQQSWRAEDGVSADNQANLEATVLRALELGINHIETARGYGTSEKQLGELLPRLERDRLIVQTKIAPTEDPAEFEHDFFDSMARLRLSQVELLSLHGINDATTLEWAVRPGGCLERAHDFVRRGLARHVGFSTHGGTETIVAAIEDGRFEYVNLHHYWAYQSNAPAVRAAAARDMGVFIISPSDKGGRLFEPPPKLVSLTAPLSPMVFNDLFCLAQSDVHTLSIGAARPTDFDEHVKAVELLGPHTLDPRALVAPIEARLSAEMERVLGREWVNTWQVGLPPFADMPGEINAREILRLYNLARSLDMVEYARKRYNLLENGGHWFPGRTAERVESLELGAALAHSPHREQIPRLLAEAHQLLGGTKERRLQQD